MLLLKAILTRANVCAGFILNNAGVDSTVL